MLSSMTGYGSRSLPCEGWEVRATIRSLNSKGFDLSLHLPPSHEEKGQALRQELAQACIRGKVSLIIEYRLGGEQRDVLEKTQTLRPEAFASYLQQLRALIDEHNLSVSDEGILAAVSSFPLLSDKRPALQPPAALWSTAEEALRLARLDCQEMQHKEGEKITQLIVSDLEELNQRLQTLIEREPLRGAAMNAELRRKAQEALGAAYESPRFEQELFFYLERMDFSEEKERLLQHLKFFGECLSSSQAAEAKRLLFIAQEIGRELNTLGVKSHDAPIQHEIVHMKSALERIKEQLHNVR